MSIATAHGAGEDAEQPQDHEGAGVRGRREDRREQRPRRREAHLDQLHHALIDVELGHPLRRVGEVSAPYRGLVYLRSLDAPPAGQLAYDALGAAVSGDYEHILPLVKGLAGREGPPQLWLVTRGAQPMGAEPGLVAVAQAPVPHARVMPEPRSHVRK